MSKPKDSQQGLANQGINQQGQQSPAAPQEQQEDQLVGPQGDQTTNQNEADRQRNQEQRGQKQRR